MEIKNTYELYCDGACLPNPGGEASFGFVLNLNGKFLTSGQGIIGFGGKTNNINAEYCAISNGLNQFIRLWDKYNSELFIYSDSDFVVKQLTGKNKPRFDFSELRIVDFTIKLIKSFGVKVYIIWISREKNKIANDLAKSFRS